MAAGGRARPEAPSQNLRPLQHPSLASVKRKPFWLQNSEADPSNTGFQRQLRRSSSAVEAAADLLEAAPQLGLESAVGGLVEAPALELLGHQLLPGKRVRLVVRIDVALAAPEFARA